MAKRTKNTSRMHPTQSAYALARATYEAAVAAHLAECRAAGLLGRKDDETSDLIDECSDRHSTARLWQVMRQAERTMVAWSLEAARRIARPGAPALDATDVEAHPDLWQELVESAFRFAQ